MNAISVNEFTKTYDLPEINSMVQNSMTDYISKCEKEYHDRIKEISKEIADNKECKIIMLAGPSGSGKTTTANLIATYLKDYGINTTVLSIDDFYLSGDDAPKTPDGKRDYETVYSIDIPLVRESLTKLLTEGECMIPKYFFGPGLRIDNHTRVELGKDDITIIEGLHALNPLFTDGLGLSGILKMYVNPGAVLSKDGEIIFDERSLRLMRRMVRDFKFRGASPELTLSMWPDVIDGEGKYIHPFIKDADFLVRTFHRYEPSVIGKQAQELLEKVPKDDPFYNDAVALQEKIDHLYLMDDKEVPFDSLLREFLGNGKFN